MHSWHYLHSNNFVGPVVEPMTASHDSSVYPSRLHLSTLKGKRKDVYAYLANAQRTKFAVTPIHTTEEFKLFHLSVSVGGEFSVPNGKPNFDLMAAWWSSKADGITIFYKLREHLASHHKTWCEQRKEIESMIVSRPQRQRNENRIRSAHHVSHVLAPAQQDQPGIIVEPLASDIVMAPPVDNSLAHSPTGASPQQNAVSAAQGQFGDPFDDIQLPETTPVFSSAINQNETAVSTTFIQPAIAVGPLAVAGPSTINFVSWAGQRKRRCAVCKESGRSGYDCPGETNRSRCRYLVS